MVANDPASVDRSRDSAQRRARGRDACLDRTERVHACTNRGVVVARVEAVAIEDQEDLRAVLREASSEVRRVHLRARGDSELRERGVEQSGRAVTCRVTEIEARTGSEIQRAETGCQLASVGNVEDRRLLGSRAAALPLAFRIVFGYIVFGYIVLG